LDGFSFCVSDILTKEDLFFTEYLFDNTKNSPEELYQQIETIFKTDLNLQHEFNNVSVIHENSLSTLVPSAYFDEKFLAEYLNFNIKTLKTDFIAFDDLLDIDAKNIFVPYVNINNYLFQNFGEFNYKHHLSVLIEKLLKTVNSEEQNMFVNVAKHSIDIIVLKNSKVIFCNSFSSWEQEIRVIIKIKKVKNLTTEYFCVFSNILFITK
jgi:hypothetical protein